MLILKDLIQRVDFEEVFKEMKVQDKKKSSYFNVFENLRTLTPYKEQYTLVFNNDKDDISVICISEKYIECDENSDLGFLVCDIFDMKESKPLDYYRIWTGAAIKEEIESHLEVVCVAICLAEIVRYGFDEDTIKKYTRNNFRGATIFNLLMSCLRFLLIILIIFLFHYIKKYFDS